ncbi:ricin-type beta-trefoil lectin domain protein [Streptomyces sp. QTS52]
MEQTPERRQTTEDPAAVGGRPAPEPNDDEAAVWEQPLPWPAASSEPDPEPDTVAEPEPVPAPVTALAAAPAAGTAGRSSDGGTATRPDRPTAVPPTTGQDEVPAGEFADSDDAVPPDPDGQRSRLLDRLASLRALAASSRDADDEGYSPSSGGSGPSAPGPSDAESTAKVPGAVVAGAVLLVCALAAVPFLLTSGDDTPGQKHADSAADAPSDVTVRYNSPGVTNGPSAPAPGKGGSSHKPAKDAGEKSPVSATDEAGGDAANTDADPDGTSSGKPASSGGKNTKPAGGGGTTTAAPTTKAAAHAAAATSAAPAPAGKRIAGYPSSRCIEISSHSGTDGSPLRLWDCGGASWQKWVFKSDGSVRSMGLCMDAANAGTANGTRVQLAICNGGSAQQFNLNGSHDLVNIRAGKCVDAVDTGTGNGTRLQLWECEGSSNQKWYLK